MKENTKKVEEKGQLQGVSIGLMAGSFLFFLLSAFIESFEIKILIVGIVSFIIYLYERSINEFE